LERQKADTAVIFVSFHPGKESKETRERSRMDRDAKQAIKGVIAG
jgi:hypothetical protein